VERLLTGLSSAEAPVEILINNAGMGVYGELQNQPIDALARMLAINVVALTTLSRLVLPGMLARKQGRILNLASVVGYQPGGPRMAAYYASKSYVLSLSRGLARELKGSGISVTALSPGPTETAFEQRAGVGNTLLYSLSPKMTAREVAQTGYRAMMRGQPICVPGLGNKFRALAAQLLPRAITLEVNSWLLQYRARE
jgi:short-subunit dehydrogenase